MIDLMHSRRRRLARHGPTRTMSWSPGRLAHSTARLRWAQAARSVDAVLLVLGLTAMLLLTGVVRAAPPTGPHILVLEDESAERQAYVGFMQGLREGLAPLGSAVLFTENLDLARFPRPEHLQRQSDWLKAKYRDVGIDIVVAGGPRALTYALRDRVNPRVSSSRRYSGSEKKFASQLRRATMRTRLLSRKANGFGFRSPGASEYAGFFLDRDILPVVACRGVAGHAAAHGPGPDPGRPRLQREARAFTRGRLQAAVRRLADGHGGRARADPDHLGQGEDMCGDTAHTSQRWTALPRTPAFLISRRAPRRAGVASP